MKLSDVVIGGIVYFKKSARLPVDSSIPYIVDGIEQRKGKHDRILVNGLKVNPGDLTDVPCGVMTCEECKYHRYDKRG